MYRCERCGMSLDEDQVFNADEFGYTSVCEDCSDLICVYEGDEE